MPVDGGALGTVIVEADADGDGLGDGEVICANATPNVRSPETPNPAAAIPIFLIIYFTSFFHDQYPVIPALVFSLRQVTGVDQVSRYLNR